MWFLFGKKKFNVDCHLVLISNYVPDFLKEYSDNITLFQPLPNIHTAFIAQVIRILYPCMYRDKNVLITDVDIFPISYQYFIKSVEKISDNSFISYRNAYQSNNMIAICYNLANASTWREIFGMDCQQEIIKTIINWYQPQYDGTKNCIGWFTDQKKLYEYISIWKQRNNDRHVILDDKNMGFSRLDKRKRNYILCNLEKVKNDICHGLYTDFHCIKPYHKYKKQIEEIIDTICKSG